MTKCNWCDQPVADDNICKDEEGAPYHSLCLKFKDAELRMIEDMIQKDRFKKDVPEYDALEELERVFNKAQAQAYSRGQNQQVFEVVCAKCGKNKVEDKWIHKTDNGFQVTHTFCPDCCNETRRECYGTNDL